MEKDFEKMVRDIDAIVNTEWHADLEMRHMHDEPYTQEETNLLAEKLGRVYMISHGITCKTCGAPYEKSSAPINTQIKE